MRLDNQWLTVPTAARLLGRSSRAVHRAIERGSIPVQRIPRAHCRVAACVVAEPRGGVLQARSADRQAAIHCASAKIFRDG